MNIPSNAMPESFPDAKVVTHSLTRETRPFYTSVKRELWEYRSIYLAPLGIAGVILLGNLFVLGAVPRIMRNAASLDPALQHDAIVRPYHFAAALIMGAAFIVSIFYSLDALYGERRDRSILFWKSLPVSDLTTVLAKAAIPLLALPMIAFAITFVTTSIMLLLSSLVLLASGLSVSTLWSELAPYQSLGMLLYHLVTVHMLWYAPIYAWLLLISAWARRAPFLWAVLPPLAIGIFEKIVFHSTRFAAFLGYRVGGGGEAVDSMQGNSALDPHMHSLGDFLTTPGLWIGLAFAAMFLVAAARLRRRRGPI